MHATRVLRPTTTIEEAHDGRYMQLGGEKVSSRDTFWDLGEQVLADAKTLLLLLLVVPGGC